MFNKNNYFCQRCAEKPRLTIISYSGRQRIGCSKHCPINTKTAADAYKSVFDWKENILQIAANDPNGELIVLYALNNNQALLNGDVIVRPMKDSRHFMPADCFASLQHNILVWKLPIAQAFASNYCLPLALSSMTTKTNTDVSKIILLMIGNCFMDPLEVLPLFDSILHHMPTKTLVKMM